MEQKEKKIITFFLVSLLKKSTVLDYRVADIEGDNDVNILVFPKLKFLNGKRQEDFMFFIYCTDRKNLTLYCPTLYNLKAKDSAMFTLNAINIVNSKISVGKIYLNEANRTIISYINKVLFNDITKELTLSLLNNYVKFFLVASMEFYKLMQVTQND